jgi:outer membrane immunogenic protein
MRKLLLGSAMSIAMVASASAADMYVKAPPAWTWSGIYFGGSAGGLWDNVDGSFVNPPPGTWSTSHSTGLLGGQVGLQKQFGSIVLGVEGNFLDALRGGGGTGPCNPVSACTAGFTLNEGLRDGLFTIGPRAGWALGSWLPYVTGGYASAKEYTEVDPTPGAAATQSTTTTHSGWYIGGGVDWLLAPHWVVGAEYRYYQFNSQTATPVSIPGGIPITANTWTIQPTASTAVLRLNYLFNWNGPVVTRY